MKRLLHFTFLLLSIILFHTSPLHCQDRTEYLIQNILNLYKVPFTWNDSIICDNDSLKEYALKQFYKDNTDYYLGAPKWRLDISLDSFKRFYAPSFHLIDLNADNKCELVFNGEIIGRMGIHMNIYSFDGKDFVNINYFYGQVVKLIKQNDNKIDMVICQYPCCGNIYNELQFLEMNDSNYFVTDSVTFAKGGSFYFCQTSLPKTISPPNEITIDKGAELDFWYLSDTIPNCDPYNERKLITLGVTKEKIKTVYYGKYENGKKNTWYFVQITPDMGDKIDVNYGRELPNFLVWITQ